MKDINLLKDFHHSGTTIKIVFIIGAIVIAIGALILLGIVFPLMHRNKIALDFTDYFQEIEKYHNIEKEYEQLSKDIEILNQKNEDIAPIKNECVKWSHIFSQLEKTIPDSVILYKISYSDGSTTIQGSAPTDIEIAKFLVQLKNMDFFSSVKLKSIDGHQDSNEQIFVIVCTTNLPALITQEPESERGADD